MSREEIITELSALVTQFNPFSVESKAICEAIKALEEQRTGHWFIDERPESNRETVCSICEQPVFKFHKLDFDYRPHYCPNCGAKMQ